MTWKWFRKKRVPSLKDDLNMPDNQDMRLREAKQQRLEAQRKLLEVQKRTPAIIRHVGEQERIRRQNGIVDLIESALQRGL